MHKNLTKWPSSLNCFVFTEFTNLQKNLQKIKGYRNSDLFGKSSKHFLPYDSILFSTMALIANDGPSSCELDYSL